MVLVYFGMNARSAVFALISIKSHPLRELVKRLPYAQSTVYEAVRKLEKEGLAKNSDGLVFVAEGYSSQKLREIYIQALSYGMDPELLMRDSTISVWKSLGSPTTIQAVHKQTKLSVVSVKKILRYFGEKNLIEYLKKKPIIAVRDKEHSLNKLLETYLESETEKGVVYYPGSIPFDEMLKPPDQIEKMLYEQIDYGLTVTDTGFMVKSKEGRLTILESVEKELTLEEIFLRKLYTTEGVEDLCIMILFQKRIDYQQLLELAREKEMVNIVGCYLDIINDIKKIVSKKIIKAFMESKQKKKRSIFLTQEKRYSKGGWEGPYENKWNIDLYLDLGAIRHGIRSA